MKSLQLPHTNSRRSSGSRPRQHKNYQPSQKRKRQLVVMTKHTDDSASEDDGHYVMPASERVRFILGAINEKDENAKETTCTKHELFTELEEFVTYDDGHEEWKETARWFKYEEDVEEGGDRWSKPHVATLSLYSLFEVRNCLMSGTVILDMEADSLAQIADLVLDHLISCNKLEENARYKVRDTLLRQHRHQKPQGIRKGLSNIMGKNRPSSNQANGFNSRKNSTVSLPVNERNAENGVYATFPTGRKPDADKILSYKRSTFHRSESVPGHLVYQERNQATEDVSEKLSGFMKKLPTNSEASNVLVGEVDFLVKPITAFIRLEQGVILGDLTEVPIPTRFLFIMMGPAICPGKYHEIGRSISTLMADEIFHDVAYMAKKRDDLIAGFDDFLEKVTVLPPGEWDPSIRIEPPPETPTSDNRWPNGSDGRRNADTHSLNGARTGNSSDNNDEEDGLAFRYFLRNKAIFGGLHQDFCNWKKRTGDLRDACNWQCIGTVFFVYFTALAMILVFGTLSQRATNNIMGFREHILAISINGIIVSLFGGQPLVILGFTLPLVAFDHVLYQLSDKFDLDFLPFRMWIGMWTIVFLVLFLAFGVSIYVRYFSRFIIEIFLLLISFSVIYNSLGMLYEIKKTHPVSTPYFREHSCVCVRYIMDAANQTNFPGGSKPNSTQSSPSKTQYLNVSFGECILQGGTLLGGGCHTGVYFLSLLLAISSFVLVSILAYLRISGFFPRSLRRTIADCATLITVVVMSGAGYSYRNEVNISFLYTPASYSPSESMRSSWMVTTIGENSLWIVVVAVIPAVLLTMILFLEQNMATMVANKKENRLKKPYGYHLDLLAQIIGVLLSSIFGLPFTVGSALLTVNHIQSLHIVCAEYQRSKIKGVREQRFTALAVYVLLILTPLFHSALKCIPQPVLLAILAFAGFRMIHKIQFMDRLRVMLMPPKNQPDMIYLRQIPTLTVHFYTIIQILCFVFLCGFRMTEASIAFPFAVILVMLFRIALSKLFSSPHLVILDELLPPSSWQKSIMMAEKRLLQDLDKEVGEDIDTDDAKSDEVIIDFRNGDSYGVSISEEIVKMPVWKKLIREESSPATSLQDSPKHNDRKRRRKSRKKQDRTRSSPKPESEDDKNLLEEFEISSLPAPWDLPYQSPPRTDSKFLTINDYEVNVDPACSRPESKSVTTESETNKSDGVYS
ncbi:electrogenic sodium bicarbonate cotransporter 1-like isoform X2 [Rhopilema esculentum]